MFCQLPYAPPAAACNPCARLNALTTFLESNCCCLHPLCHVNILTTFLESRCCRLHLLNPGQRADHLQIKATAAACTPCAQVNVLTIFIESNQGDEDTTIVQKLAVFGSGEAAGGRGEVAREQACSRTE